MGVHNHDSFDVLQMAYLNPAAMSRCYGSGSARGYDPATCRGQYRGMWQPGKAYAVGDVIYICADYEEPSEGNLYRALRTHCAAEDDRPESGVMWMRFWQVRLRPGQNDDLDEFGPW